MTLCIMKYLMCTAIALSIVWLPQKGVYGSRGQEFKLSDSALEAPPKPPSLRVLQSENFFLDQLLAAANENRDAYVELQTYHRPQPNYLVKLPVLLDLPLSSMDLGNNFESNNINDRAKNYEIPNSRLIDRMRQLSDIPSYRDEFEHMRENEGQVEVTPKNYETPNANQLVFKSHDTKKNLKFLSPCHFKLCPMGKRFV